MMGFIQRTEHDMTRADDYEYLLALAKNEVPLHEASDNYAGAVTVGPVGCLLQSASLLYNAIVATRNLSRAS